MNSAFRCSNKRDLTFAEQIETLVRTNYNPHLHIDQMHYEDPRKSGFFCPAACCLTPTDAMPTIPGVQPDTKSPYAAYSQVTPESSMHSYASPWGSMNMSTKKTAKLIRDECDAHWPTSMPGTMTGIMTSVPGRGY